MQIPARAPLMPLTQALGSLLVAAESGLPVEIVSTLDADGRVLAEDVVSALHVPPQDNSAMDGYAVRCADFTQGGAVFSVTQRIAAGSSGHLVAPFTCARIFTGAPIPPGADAVVMQEDCRVVNDCEGGVRIPTVPTPGQHIRRAGEDVSRGQVVLQSGQRIGPAEMGLAASVGLDTLRVAHRPRVALFSTGDELVMPGAVAPEAMLPGAIYNSNRFFLAALLRRMGCTVTDFGIVPDQMEVTVAALHAAAQQHDLILTSGGVSVGEEDHVKPAVQRLGALDLWQIAIKPGKPFAYGQVGSTHFIGLPGNPVSSLVTFLLLVRPFLLRLQGVTDVAMKTVAARADFAWPKADFRQEFLRVRRNGSGGLDLFPNQSSGVLTSVVWADGLIDNPAQCVIVPGDTVRYVPFEELWG